MRAWIHALLLCSGAASLAAQQPDSTTAAIPQVTLA